MSTIAALRPRREIGGDGSLSVSDSLEFGNELVLLPDCREVILAIIYRKSYLYRVHKLNCICVNEEDIRMELFKACN